ncbi:MAG: TraR/DksA C4-type zinc finger protein [Actinobacteria bacterium]|nr:TraR/DksA C4-type zinc finger protein [Actinomycetota bacterium]
MLEKKQIEKLRESLVKRKKELLSQYEKLQGDSLKITQTGVSGESPYSFHIADEGTDTFERERDFTMGDSLKVLISRIDKALEKIENGTYGICEICGKDIGYERLKAIPFVDLCIDCKREDLI